MPKIFATYIAALLILLLHGFCGRAAVTDTVQRIHADLPALDEQYYLSSDVFFSGIVAQSARLNYTCYKYGSKGDSTLLCRKERKKMELKGDLAKQSLRFTPTDGPAYYLPVFYSILRKTGIVPAGTYKVFIELKNDSGAVISRSFAHQVDSALPPTSPLRKALNNTLLPENKAKILGISLAGEAKAINTLAANTSKTVDRAAGKIDRLFKSRGLTSITEKKNGRDYISLYYEDWFIGYYEIALTQSLSTQIRQQQDALTAPVASLAKNELEGYRSIFSQVKDLVKLKKEDRELSGQIGLTGNWANKQPEYSAEENNYYELRGDIETSIQDMPIGIEGYYTTQDRNRTVKASYIRVHYDADKAKEGLVNLLSGFKNQLSQTIAKGKGLEQVYGSYLNNLKGQEAGMLNDLKKETGVYDINTSSLDTNGLKQKITAALKEKISDTAALPGGQDDSCATDAATGARSTAAKARQLADSANRVYQKALKRYQQLVELEQKAQKYYKLLDQYKNTTYFDSAAGSYEKLQDLDKADATTYKQLAKTASALLPEGKVKKFATGITNLDAGIFPKEVSRYTMAGQQLKGLDVGYDLDFCQVGATAGATEFIGRDGTLDKYTAYSGRVLIAPSKKQKITLVYYGYSPSKKAVNHQDTFFRNVDLAYPTFQKPVHIISAAYTGSITKYVTAEGEIATSFQSGKEARLSDKLSADNLAYHLNATGRIPKSAINVEAGYEHAGKDFQNSTLPLNLSGTDRLQVGAKGDFFKSFLTLGIEYNHIEQHSFSGTGNNNRWGFEISTHSKRYPSLALSYKPYTTFRSYTDTLAIPQRPVLGAVWTGRGSYQIKKKGGISWRFSAVYNKSTAEIDTSNYGSNLVQLNVIYTSPKYTIAGSVGSMDQTANGLATDVPAHIKTTFWMMSGSYMLNKKTTIAGGYDLGFAAFGSSKYGLNASTMYRFDKVPLSIRVTGRASKYRLTEATGWKELYSGSLDLLWRFKLKLKDPK